MEDAFYIPDGPNRFASTEWTMGPWGPSTQHAGPPAALVAHVACKRGSSDKQLARATFEILRPIPIAPLEIGALVVRPGRKVELIHATMSSGGTQIMDASIWRVRTTDLDLPAAEVPPPSLPADGVDVETFLPADLPSYLSAMEWRFTKGSFLELGPATAWGRMRHPLVAGEEIDPATRALVLADSGNGISNELDFTRWVFMNTDLSVYRHRLPAGDWVCLEAETRVERTGIGTASSTLYDEKGAIGRGLQNLFIDRRV